MGRRIIVIGLVLALVGGAALGGLFLVRRDRVDVLLVPGRSVWDHAKTLAKLGFGTEQDALALMTDEAFARSLDLPIKDRAPRGDGVASTWLEGFIYPETYRIARGDPRQALELAAAQFKKVWAGLLAKHGPTVTRLREVYGLSEADLIILASLVEKEMALRDEAPRIAGVFLNRIAKGMRLETDPTLMYRPDRVGRAPTPTERRDATNPYNTYSIKGLPPGPICSPGLHALEGVLAPETHDFLFFVAKRDGTRSHAFAKTFEEHEANIDRYLRKKPVVAP
jgi:UPF0755 protein